MRIIFVPQYPTPMRYQEWWAWKLPQEFRNAGHEVLVLGEKYADMIKHRRGSLDMFSPINMAIELETEQIREYMMLDIKDDDVLFLSDISFPGLFCNVLYHKECPKMFAFCHATSINKFDYFSSRGYSKFPVESSHSILFDTVFVGSEYHQRKLIGVGLQLTDKGIYWKNTQVTHLPFPPLKFSNKKKKYDIISASRPTPQKVDLDLENIVAKAFGEIYRPTSNSWEEYYQNLAMSKILLITAHEDTFGYQIVDAILNGCVPLARNDLAYPELLPKEYLYDNPEDLLSKIKDVLSGNLLVPRLLCEKQMIKFYGTIIEEMEKD